MLGLTSPHVLVLFSTCLESEEGGKNFLKTKAESRKFRDGSMTLFSRPTCLLQLPRSLQFLKAKVNAGTAVPPHTLSSGGFIQAPVPPPSSVELASVFGPLVFLISSSNTHHHSYQCEISLWMERCSDLTAGGLLAIRGCTCSTSQLCHNFSETTLGWGWGLQFDLNFFGDRGSYVEVPRPGIEPSL